MSGSVLMCNNIQIITLLKWTNSHIAQREGLYTAARAAPLSYTTSLDVYISGYCCRPWIILTSSLQERSAQKKRHRLLLGWMSTNNNPPFLKRMCVCFCLHQLCEFRSVWISDSKFLSGSVAFILCSSRRFLSVAAILSPLVWVVFTGQHWEEWGGWQAATVQCCHSPLHMTPLSQLTSHNLGMKAAFSLFLHPRSLSILRWAMPA